MKLKTYQVTEADFDAVVGCESCDEAFEVGWIVRKSGDDMFCDDVCARRYEAKGIEVLRRDGYDCDLEESPRLDPPHWAYR